MIELEIRAHLNANLKEKIIARGAELIKDNILQTDEYFKASPQQTCVIRIKDK